jgi:hypothetical protein
VSAPEQKSSNPGWRAFLTHPVTVGIALWLFVPIGLVLLWLNPALRRDRRWWAAAAVWGLYLLWAGKLPLVGSRNQTSKSETSVASLDAEDTPEGAAPVNTYFPKDAKTLQERAKADKAFAALLSEADALWQQQQTRPDAVEKYVFLLDTYCGDGKGLVNSDVGKAHQSDLARVAVRAIDSLVETGNIAAAKKLIIAADQQNLTLVFRNPKTDSLVPKARAEKDREDREAYRELEQLERRREPDVSFGTPEPRGEPFSSVATHGEKLACMALQVRPGMSIQQVVSMLGRPDRTSVEDLGDLNPAKEGQKLTLLTWDSPQSEQHTILLSFIDNRLADGGTVGGYRITTGGRRVPTK